MNQLICLSVCGWNNLQRLSVDICTIDTPPPYSADGIVR